MSSPRPRGVSAIGDDKHLEIFAREFGNRQ
jgi:hypothetical protein